MACIAQVNWIVGTSQTSRGGGGECSSAKYATNKRKQNPAKSGSLQSSVLL